MSSPTDSPANSLTNSPTDLPANLSTGAYQLKISLIDSEPEIWRQVVVPAQMNLDRLHWVIQQAMGWNSLHRYAFHLGSGEQKVEAEPSQPISDVVASDRPLYYTYDFESGWLHGITVEAVEAVETVEANKAVEATPVEESGPTATKPTVLLTCTGGAGACPPEGTGGVWGYGDFLERLDDPEDPDYMSLIEIYGDFDPDAFDVAQAAERLQADSEQKAIAS